MKGLVVDASVALKWFVAEADSQLADGILEHAVDLHAPELLKAELANGLWQKRRKDLIDDEQVGMALLNFPRFVRSWYPTGRLVPEALRLGLRLDHPVYDLIYVIFVCLAHELNIRCVTADQRWLSKLSGTSYARHVVHLADWRP